MGITNKFVLARTVNYSLLTFSMISLCISCEKENYSDETIIRYGTSFGECFGYCLTNMEIKNTGISFSKSGWNKENELPEITCMQDISAEEWDKLLNLIDLREFDFLPDIIGCPDCADGGAEWIEVKNDSFDHKVTFEYNNAPPEIEDFIKKIRSLHKVFTDSL